MTIKIVSGEGLQGRARDYRGKLTAKAIKCRLTRERIGPVRWAYITIDGRRISDEDIDRVFAATAQRIT